MGRQHRVTNNHGALSWVAGFALLAGAAGYGCSKEEDRQAQLRRDVLRANDLAAERRKQLDAVRVLDANGKLIPSDQRVAGIVLPRGYEPRFEIDHEAYYDGKVSYTKLATYFTEQLDFITIQRPNNYTLTFVDARMKGDTQMKPVDITISPTPVRSDWSRIRIQRPQLPPARLQTKAEIDAELSLRRQREMY